MLMHPYAVKAHELILCGLSAPLSIFLHPEHLKK